MPTLDVAAEAGVNGVNFSSREHVEYVQQHRVSAGYFRALGVPPQLGREFSRAEDVPGGPAVAVLSYEFWQRAFRGDASALGQSIDLRGEPYQVIGIMPRGFRVSAPVDVWTPLRPSHTGEGEGVNYQVIARLKPGVSWAEAGQRVKALSRGIFASPEFPQSRDAAFEERLIPFQKGVTQDARNELLLTWGAVLLLLLIGCVNIAGLLLARSAARSHEMATRMALGAGPAAIVRQLLVESLLLSLAGCFAGVVLGLSAVEWLKRLGADRFELWRPIALDWRVLAAMLATAVAASLLFGLAPAVASGGLDVRSVLVEGGRGILGRGRGWARRLLVTSEIALSLVLLVGAGLMVRTLAYLDGRNPGFDTHNVLTADASLQDARYRTSAAVNALYTQSLARIRNIPGVVSAAVALTLPYERPLNDGIRVLDGLDSRVRAQEVVYATPGYFETMRIPIFRGRGFLESDTARSARVAVVSESFARKMFANADAVGRHLAGPMEIVGVVGDVQQHSGLGNFGPISIDPTVYIAASQTQDDFLQEVHAWFPPKWVVRTGGPVANLAAQVQAAVTAVDPQLPLAHFGDIDKLRADITSGERYHAALFSIVAGLALLFAAIGLYGLISYSFEDRRQELGVRMALGATAGQAIRSIVQPGLALALAGVAGGICALPPGGLLLLESLLWGVRPTDSATFAAPAVVLLLVAACASLSCRRRVLRLDPAVTLRKN